MAALSVLAPYPIFNDRDGLPIDDGNIYIGTVNLDPVTNPIQVYWDEALTIPASQPIKTNGGYPSFQGTPSTLYVNADDFSITVKDKNNLLVYTALQASLKLTFDQITGTIGADRVSFSQSATYPSGTVGKKLQQFICPLDAPYSAAGDGSTDDTAAVLAALQSGYPVDLAGRTYSVDTLTPSSFKGLRNGTLKWRNPVQQAAVLALVDISDFFIDNVTIDLGSTQNTGSAADSNRQGLKVISSNPGTTYVYRFNITRLKVKGDGNGSRIQIRSAKHFHVDLCDAYDGTVAYSPDPSNDAANGFDFKYCSKFTVSNCLVWNLATVVASVTVNKNTRGYLFAECQDFLDIGNSAYLVGQGCDYSGAITVTDTIGNRGFSKVGGTYDDCYLVGVKFANVTRSGRCEGVTVNRPGSWGIICSGSSVALTDKTLNTSFIDVIGCTVTDPTTSGGTYPSPQAFRVMQGPDTGWPRGIRFIGCVARDSQGTPKMYNGFASDVTYDGTSKALNEVINCRSYGQTSVGFNGFGSWNVILTGSTTQSINSGSQTDLTWDVETLDSSGAHSGSSSDVTIQRAGWWRISFSLAFASNSTGYRSGIILQNGSVIPGGTVTLAAVTGSASVVQGFTLRQCAVGDVIKVAALQNSGGALNVDKAASQFALQLVEPGE